MSGYERKDHYHRRAKAEGYRSRAAYKLAEIQRAHRLLRAGQRVADLGCWPGGWLQVAAEHVGRKGRVVGVDMAAIDPPLENENTVALTGDLTELPVVEALLDALGGPADVVLCDAAPKLTGIRTTDHAREGALLEAVEACLPRLLAPGGSLLVKILEGPDAQAVDHRLRAVFERSVGIKPKATRRGSAERYRLGKGYKGASRPGPDRKQGGNP